MESPEINVISLARTPDRLKSFRENNSWLEDFEIFSAVDGSQLTETEMLEIGLITKDLNYRTGALGNALSHQALWEKAIRINRPLTICEDDAILHSKFSEKSNNLMADLSEAWDLIVWGWNFDSILQIDMPGGLGHCLMTFDQNELRKNFEFFNRSKIDPTLFKFRHAFGTVAYTISPQGARKMLSATRPITKFDVYFPGLSRTLSNVALDITMNAFYKDSNCYVSYPPLVITQNDASTSTVQEKH